MQHKRKYTILYKSTYISTLNLNTDIYTCTYGVHQVYIHTNTNVYVHAHVH